jgi:hypothetical protein
MSTFDVGGCASIGGSRRAGLLLGEANGLDGCAIGGYRRGSDEGDMLRRIVGWCRRFL